jgi:hypothetical protein
MIKDTLIALSKIYSTDITLKIYDHNFLPKYHKKHKIELFDALESGMKYPVDEWYERRDKVFERYAKIHYKVK